MLETIGASAFYLYIFIDTYKYRVPMQDKSTCTSAVQYAKIDSAGDNSLIMFCASGDLQVNSNNGTWLVRNKTKND